VEWQLLTAAALVGIASTALDLGVAYATERHQFGVPIGSFQAVQHALADLPGRIDGARLLVHQAAWALDGGGDGVVDIGDEHIEDGATLAAMAFLFATDTASDATARSLHVHGGYGFSEEYDIQLLYRRARGWPLVAGDLGTHYQRLADRLLGGTTPHEEVPS
jgi:alkylation response protein AidB-like acyl-CoA dehydrogenase